MTRKNSYIELCRFIGCVLIMLQHLYFMGLEPPYVFYGACPWADYFFILSGAFTMRHVEVHKDEILLKKENAVRFPLSYTLRKIKLIFPYTTIGIILFCGVQIFINEFSIKDTIRYCLYLPVQLLMLGMFGIMPDGLSVKGGVPIPDIYNIPLWYVSALIVALPIVILIIIYIGNYFRGEIYFALLCYGWIMIKYGSLAGILSPIGSNINVGVIRAMAGLFLGCGSYSAGNYLRQKKFSDGGKWLLTVVEMLTIIVAIIITALCYGNYDIVVLLFMSVSVSITFSGQSIMKIADSKMCEFMGRLSVPVFSIHLPIYLLMNKVFGSEFDTIKFCCAFILTFTVSILVLEVVKKSKRYWIKVKEQVVYS